MPATARKSNLKITTVRLPRRLYEEARCVVRDGATEASSLNDLLIDSLREKLRQLRREQIDSQFAGMKQDPRYRKEAELIADQFASNDRQTLELAEGNPV